MCGRITQKGTLGSLGLGLVDVSAAQATRFCQTYNGAPGQDHLVIRQHPETTERTIDLLRWGLIPHWSKDPSGGRKPINAKAETVAVLPSFRDAYERRRCLLPVDNFFEWKADRSGKQPYAVHMKTGEPFAIAALWENWKRPGTEEWVRTFAVLTTVADTLVGSVHPRMPVIIPPIAYDRWLMNIEPDPRDLLRPFPADPMEMWPVSTAVNPPENNSPSVLDRVSLR